MSSRVCPPSYDNDHTTVAKDGPSLRNKSGSPMRCTLASWLCFSPSSHYRALPHPLNHSDLLCSWRACLANMYHSRRHLERLFHRPTAFLPGAGLLTFLDYRPVPDTVHAGQPRSTQNNRFNARKPPSTAPQHMHAATRTSYRLVDNHTWFVILRVATARLSRNARHIETFRPMRGLLRCPNVSTFRPLALNAHPPYALLRHPA